MCRHTLIPTCFNRKLVGILFKMLKIEVYNFVTECTLRSMKRKGTDVLILKFYNK